MEFTLQLQEGTLFDDSCSLILALGIEFGSLVTNEIVKPVKYSGAAKVLGVG